MIQLYTGEGKGKTTAAVGQAVRAAGSGLSVIFAQFMKGNDTGELHSLSQIKGIEILRSSKQFGFYNTLNAVQREEMKKIHNEILDELLQAAVEKRVFMIVLDEITYPVKWELLDNEKLRSLITYAQENTLEIVMTGRNPAAFMEEAADYITEMNCLRHPYQLGVTARKGIEY